ncbi:Cilia- and flagella-associated protein 57 [Triplophysa tibetana]|uniref:Cilia-and flagella-associated protein 57 n=1 Tax=Triplophysa tibetana TaxID=1572043 RepID=A0A5A9PDY6_9TELE|nr:Cilia- and flagella-associated protein 57 [Triplophysa tibetana]
MATVVAQSHYIFGLRTGVRNNLLYSDEQTVIFPCGNNCVRYNIDQKCQRFIPGTEGSHGMKALAISTNRRYLSVSECGENATITVYDLQQEQSRKRKKLSGGEIPVEEFVCMAFSPDSKYLIGQAGGPDWTLFLWMWEKQKVMATVKTSSTGTITQVSFNPQDNTQICVSGNGVFKIFRYSGEVLKQSSTFKPDSQNFLCHTWMPKDQVIVGTETGQLMLFDSGRLRWEMNLTSTLAVERLEENTESNETQPTTYATSTLPRVTAIVGYSKGFVCSAGPGTVCLFEKTEETDQYKKTKKIKIPPEPFSNEPSSAEKQEISTLCMSPSEDSLSASTDRGQLYSLPLSLAELHKGDAHFEFMSHSFHSGVILGLSTCIRKPLIATCSLDRSVRIWNFQTNVLEMYMEFQEEAYSIALHPTGLYILVGFSDRLRLMNLLIDDISTFKEFNIRGCRECVFSHGGHLFAAVNGNVINIYSTTTFDDVLNLKGHNEKVRSIAFSSDDSHLVSCGMDGAVYEWNMLSGARESESVLKSCSYSSVAISPDSKTFFAVGTDCTLKEIQDCQIIKEVPAGDVVCTTVAMLRSGRALFVGTSIGTVRVIRYPLPIQKDWLEYQAHAGPITKMVITFDDQFLLTVSEDGCLLIWKIIDKEGRALKREKEIVYAEEILITKLDLEEKNKILRDLKRREKELQEENKYQLSLRDMTYKEKINQLTEKFIQQINSLNTEKEVKMTKMKSCLCDNRNDITFEIMVLKSEKEKQQAAQSKVLSDTLEKNEKERQDLESNNNQKLMLEYEKFQDLQLKLQRVQQQYEQQLHSVEESKAKDLDEITRLCDAKLHEKMMMLTQCQEESKQQVREFQEYIKQLEEEGDLEIQDIRLQYKQLLTEEKQTNTKLKIESDTTKKSFQNVQKEIENKNLEIEKLKQEEQKLQAVIRSLEKDIVGLKNSVQERDGIIQDKEKTIYGLVKNTDMLKNTVAVLEFKNGYIQEQIEPKENEIKELKEQMQEMEGELDEFHKKNTQQQLKIAELNLKLKTKDKEMQKEMQKVQDTRTLLNRFKSDLHKCVDNIQDPPKLKENIRELYKYYVQQSDAVETVGVDTDILREHYKQREHFEQIISSLKKQLMRDTKVNEANNVKLMKENVTLIKEINDLRQELSTVRIQLHNYESQSTFNKSKNKISTFTRGDPIFPHIQMMNVMMSFLETKTQVYLYNSNSNKYIHLGGFSCIFFHTIATASAGSDGLMTRMNFEQEAEKIIELQRLEIQRLKQQMDGQIPSSGTKLPPLTN